MKREFSSKIFSKYRQVRPKVNPCEKREETKQPFYQEDGAPKQQQHFKRWHPG